MSWKRATTVSCGDVSTLVGPLYRSRRKCENTLSYRQISGNTLRNVFSRTWSRKIYEQRGHATFICKKKNKRAGTPCLGEASEGSCLLEFLMIVFRYFQERIGTLRDREDKSNEKLCQLFGILIHPKLQTNSCFSTVSVPGYLKAMRAWCKHSLHWDNLLAGSSASIRPLSLWFRASLWTS